jgi:hypothetical protein
MMFAFAELTSREGYPIWVRADAVIAVLDVNGYRIVRVPGHAYEVTESYKLIMNRIFRGFSGPESPWLFPEVADE